MDYGLPKLKWFKSNRKSANAKNTNKIYLIKTNECTENNKVLLYERWVLKKRRGWNGTLASGYQD